MAKSSEHFKCTHCRMQFTGTPSKSFLGFRRFFCEHCGRGVEYPLSAGYRLFYVVFAAFTVISLIALMSEGKIGAPGVLSIAVIWALVRDNSIRNDVKRALPDNPL